MSAATKDRRPAVATGPGSRLLSGVLVSDTATGAAGGARALQSSSVTQTSRKSDSKGVVPGNIAGCEDIFEGCASTTGCVISSTSFIPAKTPHDRILQLVSGGRGGGLNHIVMVAGHVSLAQPV